MEHDLLRTVIDDWHDILQSVQGFPRAYTVDPQVNQILAGPRRAGKSTLLYILARRLADQGVSRNRILFINFEDERLVEFRPEDFNDILSVQAERSDGEGWFFLDEIQTAPGWETFARRLADSGHHVFIACSTAKILVGEEECTLGGRYFVRWIEPCSFAEFLNAAGIAHGERELCSTAGSGRIRRGFNTYLRFGGFPETLNSNSRREALSNICSRILLGDIVARNGLRNARALYLTVKKLAESVRNDISASRLQAMLRPTGISISKDSIISYVGHAEDAGLLFPVRNRFAQLNKSEGKTRYFFCDTGILALFLLDAEASLLENLIALHLRRRYGELAFLKDPRHGIDVDFFVPSTKTAVQVAWRLSPEAIGREFRVFAKLRRIFHEAERLLIVTAEESRADNVPEGVAILSAPKFLLQA